MTREKEEFTGFRLPADLLKKLRDSAKARKVSVSALIREALTEQLHLDSVIEGVIHNLMKVLNRKRADVIECILVDYVAGSMATMAAHPELPVVLPWAAIRAGSPLRRKELFDVLHARYLALLRGEKPEDVGVKMLSIGPASEDLRIGGAVMPIVGIEQAPQTPGVELAQVEAKPPKIEE